MHIQLDGKGQKFVEWEMPPGGWKRAWVQHRTNPDKDWAGTVRYLNVVRVEGPNIGLGGQATDFPIYNRQITDEDVLKAFVAATCAVTGCPIP